MQPGVYRLRPEQNGIRLLNAFGASKCIGETDPPGCVLRLNLHKVAGNRCGHIPLLGRHVDVNTGSQDLVVDLVLGSNLLKDQRRSIEHSQFKIAARCKDMSLPIGSQRIGVLAVTARRLPVCNLGGYKDGLFPPPRSMMSDQK